MSTFGSQQVKKGIFEHSKLLLTVELRQHKAQDTSGRKPPVNTLKSVLLGIIALQLFSHQDPVSFKLTVM